MLRGLLLLGATLPLVGLGSASASHLHDGSIAFAHVGNVGGFQIYTVTATGRGRRRLTRGNSFSSFAPSYSASGKRIVFVRASKQDDLWTMSASGSEKQRLTWTKGIDETDPVWSPNGREIAFAVDRPVSEQGIWVEGVDGHDRSQLTNGADSNPSWSPDGNEIAFTRSDAPTQTDSIFVVPAAGGTPTLLTSDAGYSDFEPTWSPDGSRILFVSDRADQYQSDLWVMNADGSNIRRVTNTPFRDEHSPAWSPDGRRIVYVGESSSHGASSYQLYVSRADGANRRIITHACGECAIINDDPSWQPLPG
jgi:Tol biopolymer transport system component